VTVIPEQVDRQPLLESFDTALGDFEAVTTRLPHS
jgi:hypothetical protein